MGQCSGAVKDTLSRRKNALLYFKRFKMPTFSQFPPFFSKTQRHLYVVIIFKTEGSKEFNFWTDFYFALSAKYLLQRHATHVCFHISISVIIHHQTLTGWKFYHEERKHQGILLFYPKTIIDKINYTNCFPKAPKS